MAAIGSKFIPPWPITVQSSPRPISMAIQNFVEIRSLVSELLCSQAKSITRTVHHKGIIQVEQYPHHQHFPSLWLSFEWYHLDRLRSVGVIREKIAKPVKCDQSEEISEAWPQVQLCSCSDHIKFQPNTTDGKRDRCMTMKFTKSEKTKWPPLKQNSFNRDQYLFNPGPDQYQCPCKISLKSNHRFQSYRAHKQNRSPVQFTTKESLKQNSTPPPRSPINVVIIWVISSW